MKIDAHASSSAPRPSRRIMPDIARPIAVLPAWLQPVAWAIPSAHVFEGMRTVLLDHVFRWDHFWMAVTLNLVYLALGAAVFGWAVRHARDHGTLLQMGE